MLDRFSAGLHYQGVTLITRVCDGDNPQNCLIDPGSLRMEWRKVCARASQGDGEWKNK
jgi:hypothetical protein